MNGVPLPVFQVVRQSVEAEFVSAFHKFVQLEGDSLFRRQRFLFAEPLTLLIEVVDSCPHGLFVRLLEIVYHDLAYSLFLRYACLEAMFCQTHQQLLQVIASFPFFHFIQCFAEGCFK